MSSTHTVTNPYKKNNNPYKKNNDDAPLVEDPKGTQDFSRNDTMGYVTRGAQYCNTEYSGIPKSPVLVNTTDSAVEDIDTNKENINDDDTMGCQSQTRKGSIKAAKAAASGRKVKHKRYTQRTLFDNIAFEPTEHCRLCKAWNKVNLGIIDKEAIPHVGHHSKCPKKKTDKNAQNFEKIMKLNAAWNNTPIVKTPGSRKEGGDIRTMIGGTPTTPTPTTVTPEATTTLPPIPNATKSTIEEMKETLHLGTMLRNILESEMKKYETDATMQKSFKKSNVPLNLFLMFRFLHSETKIRQRTRPLEAADDCNKQINTCHNIERRIIRETYLPPGECFFVFPKDLSNEPNPHYHALEGTKIFMLDWMSMYPTLRFKSPCCQSMWCHGRTNFSHNKTLFPIQEANGVTTFGSVMHYKCDKCNEPFHANDASLLLSLPPHIRQQYPVDIRYAANKSFHMSLEAGDEFDAIMATYGNGNFFSRKLYQLAGKRYLRMLESYISAAPTKAPSFPYNFQQWLHRMPPSGETLRKLYLSSENAVNLYGYSNIHRYNLEMQSVGSLDPTKSTETICSDHTFAVTKNYRDRCKACFTIKISTGETAGLYLVDSTSISEVMHGLQELAIKRKFVPKLWWTDNMPANLKEMHNLFGHNLMGRLGLFHAIQRVTKTWQKVEMKLYWEAKDNLCMCFYRYNENDLAKLHHALRTGLLSSDGTPLTYEGIKELRRSKRWKQRYDQYLRKEIHDPAVIATKLGQFQEMYQSKVDEDGKELFTRNTSDAIADLLPVLKYLQDPPPEEVSVYREIKPPLSSTHNLSVWESRRLESHLEQFHKQLAHFGNTSMNKELADALSMRGTCENNVLVRHTAKIKEGTAGPRDLPIYLHDIPAFLDHSLLHYINVMCTRKEMQPLFDNVTTPPNDNGERFLSVYLDQQRERNKKLNYCRNINKQCNCRSCLRNPFPLIGTLPVSACHCGYVPVTPTAVSTTAPFPTCNTVIEPPLPTPTPPQITNQATPIANQQLVSQPSSQAYVYIRPQLAYMEQPG